MDDKKVNLYDIIIYERIGVVKWDGDIEKVLI